MSGRPLPIFSRDDYPAPAHPRGLIIRVQPPPPDASKEQFCSRWHNKQVNHELPVEEPVTLQLPVRVVNREEFIRTHRPTSLQVYSAF